MTAVRRTGQHLAQTAFRVVLAMALLGTGQARAWQDTGHASWLQRLHAHLPGQAQAAQETPTPAGTPGTYDLGGVRVVDIQTLSDHSQVVVDPTCRRIVQPFTAGSVVSLAGFIAKWKASRMLGLGTPQGGVHELAMRAAMQLNWLPARVETALGERLLARDQPRILPRDGGRIASLAYAHADQVLARVLAQVPPDLPYPIRIYVLKEAQGNASSLPGGVVLVDEDVVGRRWDPDMAFFKIAHEVSHILQRHQTHAYQAAIVDGYTQVDQLSSLFRHVNQNSPGSLANQLWNFKSLVVGFSVDQELQADACAVRLMDTGYPSREKLLHALTAVLDSFPAVAPGTTGQGSPKDLLGTVKVLTNGVYEKHPDSAERRSNILKEVRALSQPAS